MGYEFIEHTADLGMRVRAHDLKALFEEAGRALADIAGASCSECSVSLQAEIQGIDHVDLLVRWLQELLFLVEVKGLRISSTEILDLTETRLRVGIHGKYAPVVLKHEIKAVTYHNLAIRHIDNAYEATIILDV